MFSALLVLLAWLAVSALLLAVTLRWGLSSVTGRTVRAQEEPARYWPELLIMLAILGAFFAILMLGSPKQQAIAMHLQYWFVWTTAVVFVIRVLRYGRLGSVTRAELPLDYWLGTGLLGALALAVAGALAWFTIADLSDRL